VLRFPGYQSDLEPLPVLIREADQASHGLADLRRDLASGRRNLQVHIEDMVVPKRSGPLDSTPTRIGAVAGAL